MASQDYTFPKEPVAFELQCGCVRVYDRKNQAYPMRTDRMCNIARHIATMTAHSQWIQEKSLQKHFSKAFEKT